MRIGATLCSAECTSSTQCAPFCVPRFYPYRIKNYELVSAQARYWLCLTAAVLARYVLNVPVPLIPIQSSPQSMALLQALFRPLGQVAAVELGSTRRQVEAVLSNQYFSGYSVYATCPDLRF